MDVSDARPLLSRVVKGKFPYLPLYTLQSVPTGAGFPQLRGVLFEKDRFFG